LIGSMEASTLPASLKPGENLRFPQFVIVRILATQKTLPIMTLS
jgi:hypothetical protein